MENTTTSELIEIQRENLLRAIEFLKFAEAKNGVAVAFASALILTLVELRGPVSNLGIAQLIGILFALAGALVSARSFMPRLRFQSSSGDGADTDGNLLFFGEIAKLSEQELELKIASRYSDTRNLLKDYSNQVLANSKIAKDKMGHFSLAVMLIAIGALFALASIASEIMQRL